MPLDRDLYGKEKDFAKKYKEYSTCTDPNSVAIHTYVKSKEQSVHPRRLVEYYKKLGMLSTMLNNRPFTKLTVDDVTKLFKKFKKRKGYGGKTVSTRTVNNYKDDFKRFLKFLKMFEVAESIRYERLTQENDITSEDLPTQEDTEKLIRAASTTRDEAIFAVLGEVGCRPGELLNIQIKDLKLNSQVKTLTLLGKKRKRTRPIIGCVPHLTELLNKHPKPNDPEAMLFLKQNGKPMNPPGLRKMMRCTFQRAGVRKKSYIKIFRHAVNTDLYSRLPNEVVGKLQGHVPGSNMAKHYQHLNNKQSQEKYLELYGVTPPKKSVPYLKPKNCVVCSFENRAENITCTRCKNPLSLKHADELTRPDKILHDLLEEDNELMKQFEEKLIQKIMKKVEESAHWTLSKDGETENRPKSSSFLVNNKPQLKLGKRGRK